MQSNKFFLIVVLVVILGVLLTACGSKTESTATQPPAPAKDTVAPVAGEDGEALLNTRCTKCHTTEKVTSTKKSADDWEETVTRMVGKGASLSTEEQQVLVNYLAKTYAP